jgi:hypothetical protein
MEEKKSLTYRELEEETYYWKSLCISAFALVGSHEQDSRLYKEGILCLANMRNDLEKVFKGKKDDKSYLQRLGRLELLEKINDSLLLKSSELLAKGEEFRQCVYQLLEDQKQDREQIKLLQAETEKQQKLIDALKD